jgi:hypothetical protein
MCNFSLRTNIHRFKLGGGACRLRDFREEKDELLLMFINSYGILHYS